VAPPLTIGPPEEQLEQLKSVRYVPVTALGRYALNRRRMGELLTALQTTVAHHDELLAQLEEQEKSK
jgi:hypothetical protein